ncbi:dual specificity protein kinase yak1 [Tieghemiomyces parasiticus]|uniref:Dual specificity protein kinase yak1 n=1 Tax=Tieghemiomyces parasiticus TaxID=78921 RepID=A0A9W8DQS2_9FUNG|nr:dual specificity protein kinase yak1 [Tieghemiomyces parasiticus]
MDHPHRVPASPPPPPLAPTGSYTTTGSPGYLGGPVSARSGMTPEHFQRPYSPVAPSPLSGPLRRYSLQPPTYPPPAPYPELPTRLCDRGRSNSLLQLHQRQLQWEHEVARLRQDQARRDAQRQRERDVMAARQFVERRLPFRPLAWATAGLLDTYRRCNPDFRYESARNPRRALTKPSEGTLNGGYDNENSDYILYVNDILGNEEGAKYIIREPLGAGTFGQVVKCQDLRTGATVAVKVVKNKPAFHQQGLFEVQVLRYLNERHDPDDTRNILRLLDAFVFRGHLCLVFECLSVNLYELIRQNRYQGVSTNLVRVLAAQILDCLVVLNEARVIHCDLKPENILLKRTDSAKIKVIDFGSACMEQQTVHTYIQSRFYRSPEVLLGLPYTAAIDMWSLGCIVIELFIGLPLFPGASEYDQLSRIIELLGLPPVYMLERGKQAGIYFARNDDPFSTNKYRFKPREQFARESGRTEAPSRKYIKGSTLTEVVMGYPMSSKLTTPEQQAQERMRRAALVDFATGLLHINPLQRWTPRQARSHPFITDEPFLAPFTPPTDRPSASSLHPRHASIDGYATYSGPRHSFGPTGAPTTRPAARARAATLVDATAAAGPAPIPEATEPPAADHQHLLHYTVRGEPAAPFHPNGSLPRRRSTRLAARAAGGSISGLSDDFHARTQIGEDDPRHTSLPHLGSAAAVPPASAYHQSAGAYTHHGPAEPRLRASPILAPASPPPGLAKQSIYPPPRLHQSMATLPLRQRTPSPVEPAAPVFATVGRRTRPT